MISIVVSSYNPIFFQKLCDNIHATIGVEYEVIKIDNPNLMSITAAYNIGADKSQYEYIIFCHEDVSFYENDWGKEIVKKFNSDKQLGLIGLAGSTCKPYYPSGWFFGDFNYVKWNFIQSNYRLSTQKNIHNNIQKDQEVVCIDGFFMATRKSIMAIFRFDEELLKDYHGYDLDISLSIGKQYKLIVTNDIKVEHMSLGTVNEMWLKNIKDLHFKYNSCLPISVNEMSKLEWYNTEYTALKSFFGEYYKLGFSKEELLKQFVNFEIIKRMGNINTAKFFAFLFFLFFLKKKVH